MKTEQTHSRSQKENKADSSKGQIEDKCLGSLLLPLHAQREKRWAVTRNSAGKRNMAD